MDKMDVVNMEVFEECELSSGIKVKDIDKFFIDLKVAIKAKIALAKAKSIQRKIDNLRLEQGKILSQMLNY